MDFALTDEQELLRRTVRSALESFCTKEWLDDLESREEYPADLFALFAELGLLGLGVPEELGGSGGGMVELAIVCEELGRFGGSVNMTYMPTAVFGNQTLLGGADPAMQARFIPRLCAGELRTAFALTEPEAGSDAAAIRTRAVPDGDGYVLNGSKIWSSGALAADYLVLSARTGTLDERHTGISVFMVDANSPGVEIRHIPKLGHLAVRSCEIHLTDCVVPADQVIGEVGRGWKALVRALDAERICVAAICTGLSQKCTDLALDYGIGRQQFGQPVAAFQAISHMLAEMETETAASRWLTRFAAWSVDQGLPVTKEASMAKAYATELATRTATRAMQVHGGYGYSKEFEIERFYREAKLYEVAGGSTQIQRNLIAARMGIPVTGGQR
ncbi:MAG: acyl-CoA dehydrogenase family protein [Actinomycetota bacterium]|nr:acyl-CoA dehydrogenase family protein [Actinomycetota bacterium]